MVNIEGSTCNVVGRPVHESSCALVWVKSAGRTHLESIALSILGIVSALSIADSQTPQLESKPLRRQSALGTGREFRRTGCNSQTSPEPLVVLGDWKIKTIRVSAGVSVPGASGGGWNGAGLWRELGGYKPFHSFYERLMSGTRRSPVWSM